MHAPLASPSNLGAAVLAANLSNPCSQRDVNADAIDLSESNRQLNHNGVENFAFYSLHH
jgi:hypothetical protein